MYKRILVPLDGSEASERAIPEAEFLVERGGGELVLVSAAESGQLALRLTNMVEERAWRQCEMYLKSRSALLKPTTAHRTLVLQPGNVGELLVETADELGCDLIVLTSHGRNGLGRQVLGSVAEEVARNAYVPTLILGPRCQLRNASGTLDRHSAGPAPTGRF